MKIYRGVICDMKAPVSADALAGAIMKEMWKA